MVRSGAQWRLLPLDYSHWNTVYKHFNRWSQQSIWTQVYQSMIDLPDQENLLLDTTLIRAHACTAGAKGGSPSRL